LNPRRKKPPETVFGDSPQNHLLAENASDCGVWAPVPRCPAAPTTCTLRPSRWVAGVSAASATSRPALAPAAKGGCHIRDPSARHARWSAVAVRAHQLAHAQGESLCAPLRPRLVAQRSNSNPCVARRHGLGRGPERHLHPRRETQAAYLPRPRERAGDGPHPCDLLDPNHGREACEVGDAAPSGRIGNDRLEATRRARQ